jgi:hypothetical protein
MLVKTLIMSKKFVKPVATKIKLFFNASCQHRATIFLQGLSGNGVDITLLIRGRRWPPMENMLLQLHPCGVVVVDSALTWVLPYHLTL